MILTSSHYLVILISTIPLKQEQVSDLKSKTCLCNGRTRLSSAQEAVCWLITKSLSLYALAGSPSLINHDRQRHLPWPITPNCYHCLTSPCLFFFLNSKLDSITHNIPQKSGYISLRFLVREKKKKEELCSPYLLPWSLQGQQAIHTHSVHFI